MTDNCICAFVYIQNKLTITIVWVHKYQLRDEGNSPRGILIYVINGGENFTSALFINYRYQDTSKAVIPYLFYCLYLGKKCTSQM